jgi:adenylate kinase
MSFRYQTVLLFGAPGSGKGTQGTILGQIPGFFHMSCGDVFRTIDIHSELGKLFYEHSLRGELVPDEATIAMWKQNLHAHTVLSIYKPKDDLLILDGIPRNQNQAELMREHIDVLLVVHLKSERAQMQERLRRRALKENRRDDAKAEVITRRREVYETETRRVLECYPDEVIKRVSAVGSPGMVLQQVLSHVVPVQERHFSNVLDRVTSNSSA